MPKKTDPAVDSKKMSKKGKKMMKGKKGFNSKKYESAKKSYFGM